VQLDVEISSSIVMGCTTKFYDHMRIQAKYAATTDLDYNTRDRERKSHQNM